MKKFILILFLIILIFFIYSYFSLCCFFDEKTTKDNEYQISFLDQTKNKDINIRDFIEKNCQDICLIKSESEIDKEIYKGFFSYNQFLNINLLVLSKYKLGSNKTKNLEPYLMPAYTGYIYFPQKKVLFSYLPYFFNKNFKNFEEYRKIIVRRIGNNFRNRKIPRIILTNYNFSYKLKKEFFKYMGLRYVIHKNVFKTSFDLNIYKSNNIKVFESNEQLKKSIISIGGNI